jgi:hypothetical protein
MRRAFPILACALALAQAAAPAQAQPRASDDDEPAEYRDRQDAREAYRRGYERGYDRGYAKGMAEGERRAANLRPPPPPPAPPPPVATGPIRIAGAFYGTSSRSCDASRFVRRQADGRMSTSFKVTNQMCGDPAHGDRKTLEVTYWCGPVSKSASAREHQSIYFSCP